MWNKKIYFILSSLILITCISSLMLISNYIKKVKIKYMLDYIEADRYFAPSANDTMAILLYSNHQKPDMRFPLALIGDKKRTEEITGWKFQPKKLIESHEWLTKIMDAYKVALKETEEKEFNSNKFNDGLILFIAPKITSKKPKIISQKGYSRNIGIDEDENSICDGYMESSLLKKYFDELGLTDELLVDRPKYEIIKAGRLYIPPTEKIISIILYHPSEFDANQGSLHNHPVAVFGDKKLTEKLIDKKLEPKIYIEGRDWMEKIADSYRDTLKEFEEKKFHNDPGYLKFIKNQKTIIEDKDRITLIFLTMKNGYKKVAAIDANTIYDFSMESKQLKMYFDELGITKELLAGQSTNAKPNDTNTSPAGSQSINGQY